MCVGRERPMPDRTRQLMLKVLLCCKLGRVREVGERDNRERQSSVVGWLRVAEDD